MRSTTRLAAAGILAAAALALTACSSGTGSSSSDSSSSMTSSSPSASSSMDPMADLVGPGCAAYAKQVPSGAGSVEGMAQDPVATAASNNPLLTNLVAAASGKLNPKVNLVDTLNSGQFTVFAPVDDAFAKIDAATMDTLKTDAGAPTLTSMWVRIPAAHINRSRSKPMMLPNSAATSKRSTMSKCEIIVDLSRLQAKKASRRPNHRYRTAIIALRPSGMSKA